MGAERYATIPAFVRAPMQVAAALAAVVEENEVRAPLSAYERGRVAVAARDAGLFASVEAAVARRRRRSRAAAPLAIRREAGREGCGLRFLGPEATEGLMDAVMAEIARLMRRAG